nr:MAG TPA: hypothetical protein [Caudoviricetes sp.]
MVALYLSVKCICSTANCRTAIFISVCIRLFLDYGCK